MSPDETLDQQLRAFKLNHYENLDIGYWLRKLDAMYIKLKHLKDPVKQGRVIMELYASYMQLLEILFINAYAIGKPLNQFPDAIFIESNSLKTFIADNLSKPTNYSKWLLDNCIFLQKDVAGHDDRRSDYENILMQCAKDYIDSYQLLNAYKHGYRVVAKHGQNSISLVDKHGANQIVVKCDSEITYYSKEKLTNPVDESLKNKKAIYKRRISFNNARIFGKAALVVTLLQNLRLAALQSLGKKGRERVLLLSIDKKSWESSFGDFSFKEPLFSIGKTTTDS